MNKRAEEPSLCFVPDFKVEEAVVVTSVETCECGDVVASEVAECTDGAKSMIELTCTLDKESVEVEVLTLDETKVNAVEVYCCALTPVKVGTCFDRLTLIDNGGISGECPPFPDCAGAHTLGGIVFSVLILATMVISV